MNVTICIVYLASILIDSFIRIRSKFESQRNKTRPLTRILAHIGELKKTRGRQRAMMTKEYVAWIKICIKMCISFGHFNLCVRVCVWVFIFGAIKWWTKSVLETSDERIQKTKKKHTRMGCCVFFSSVYWNSGKTKLRNESA